ncbi:MAG: TonB-dependent receptor, partial [Rhodoferax sp.]|nr:TonB-dependent receptor [Rhodoferax sp.]
SDTAFTQTSRRVSSLFAGWSGHVAAGHRLQLALRHDDDSQFGGHGTGNLGWNWALAPGWRLSAAAGTAFKAPSFNDLYYPLQWGYQGNPDLAPERSRSAEIGLHHQAGAWRVDATAFDNRIRDLIAINDSFTSVANVGRARIRGLTLRTHWAAGPWAARAEATWQTPENVDTGADLVRRAHRFGSAGLDWRSGAWQAGAELVAVGARYNDAANTDALGGHGLVNLHARWAVTPHWALSARVDNLADRAYTQVRGYDTPGRRGVIALHWQMD